MARRRCIVLGAACLPLAALAQRVDENAITSADDAFGTTVGSQTIGLYDAEHVRGFSPRAAGNLRIEGLYFDQQTFAANACLVVEQSVRVGLAAQSFDIPSPTGIANYTLHAAGPNKLTSVLVSKGSFVASNLELDGQYVLPGQRLGASLCFKRHNNFDVDFARRSHSNHAGVLLRWHPTDRIEVIPFWGTVVGNEHDMLPIVYADGVHQIPAFREQRLPTQHWTQWEWDELTAGAIARFRGAGPWTWSAGLFRSSERTPENFNDLFLDLADDRTATHVLDVTPPQRVQSTSGEVRLLRRTANGGHVHQWSLSLRGRNVKRGFGGDSITDFGRVSIDDFSLIPQPALLFTPVSEDRVRQFGFGLSYEERWPGGGSFGVSLQKVDYRRSIDAPGAPEVTDRATPLLPAFRFTANPSRQVLVYASYTRGLEDSALAPANARNRGESPPATGTWQVDAGVRVAPRAGVQVLLGAFEIRKAYFDLDASGVYAQLGQIRHRGLESSATFNAREGLTAVLGGVWLRPSVLRGGSGADPAGNVPLGTVPLLLDANVDYAPPRFGPWGLGFEWRRVSSRPATTDNRLQLPAYSTLSLNVRYKNTLAGHPCLVRLDAQDITNDGGLELLRSSLVLPEQGRRLTVTFAADF